MHYQCSSALVTLFLTTICCFIFQPTVSAQSQSSQYFTKIPTVSSSCTSTRTAIGTARSEIECAFLTSQNDIWKSFSFINGACVMSDYQDCAAVGAAEVYSKPTIVMSIVANLGYEKVIGARRFWVFHQRKTGAVSFGRNWTEYEQGFGNETEFWSGLTLLNSLSKYANATLRVEMATVDYLWHVAEWSGFTVGNASTNYTMWYTSFLTSSGNVTYDGLGYTKGMKFSTWDRDNDMKSSGSCSTTHGNAGFWFYDCQQFGPNGLYSSTNTNSDLYMHYYSVISPAAFTTLREVRMMLQL